MKKNITLAMLLGAIIFSPAAFATQSAPIRLSGQAEETKSVDPNGGVLNANIDPSNGSLSTALTPGFRITTNTGGDKFLTMSVAANTQTGFNNAVFNDGTFAYVILTNSDMLPQVASMNNIKTLAPTPASNPNAIAYLITDPPNQPGILETEFQPAINNWKLHLSKKGITDTSISIPGSMPYNNTFSGDDEAGRYQATVTLSFN